jgi:hypothetical protein
MPFDSTLNCQHVIIFNLELIITKFDELIIIKFDKLLANYKYVFGKSLYEIQIITKLF